MAKASSFSPKHAFAIAFSFSLAISSSSHSFFPLPSKFRSNLSLKSSRSSSRDSNQSPSQKLAADLLSLFGSNRDASRVPADEAQQLRSCLRFLVPPSTYSSKRFHKDSKGRRRVLEEKNEMVWWPPTPVMELARLAVDSSGDPATIQRSLDPSLLPVPDVEGLKKDKCQITRTPNGHRFASKDLNSYFEFLFELIVERAPFVGLNVSLTRYDLFHGHLFLARDTGRLGILFHAREYPAYEKDGFPYNLGFCQTGSNVIYDDSINLRNILWLAPLPSNVTKAWLAPGSLVVLDARPGGIIYKNLIPDSVGLVRTIYEDDFGEAVVDVNYLKVGNAAPGERIFVC